jgi:hypothetical protein
MIAWLIALTLGILTLAAGLVPLWLDLRDRRAFRTSIEPAHPSNVLAPPPMIDGVTLRTWLVHHHPSREHVWPQVVAEFYDRARDVPAVFSYFHGVDLDQLRTHFTAALVIVTHAGATRGAVEHVATRHAGVRNAAGVPITSDVYDAVIDTLVAVLRDARVPEHALAQLGETVAPFRAPILAAAFR